MPNPGETTDVPVRVSALANRVTILTFATAFTFLVGLVLLPSLGADRANAVIRVAAAAPLAIAGGFAVWTWHVRAQLRRARTEFREPPGAPRGTGPGDEPKSRPGRKPARSARVRTT